jgi:hypothetical protein
MPFRFKGIRKHPDQRCFIIECGKEQLIVESCDTVADLRKAARERIRDDDDNLLQWLLVLHGCNQPNPMQYFKSLEGKRISLDIAAAVKIEELT